MLPFGERVSQEGFAPEQMRASFDLAIASEAVFIGLGAKFALIPNGQFHGQRREEGGFATSPPQPRAYVENTHRLGQLEVRGGLTSWRIGGIVANTADHPIQRNLVAWIEKVIKAQNYFTIEAIEGFVGP
jgi:hypothetical protein